jgi:hypothetical protein
MASYSFVRGSGSVAKSGSDVNHQAVQCGFLFFFFDVMAVFRDTGYSQVENLTPCGIGENLSCLQDDVLKQILPVCFVRP